MYDDDLTKLIEKTSMLDDQIEITQEYLQEGQECLKNGLTRSTILLFWSIFMYKIYRKIEEYGISDFLDIVNSKSIKYNGKISTLNDLNKLKDTDIIQICHDIGFYDQNVKGLLQMRLNTRNSIAHVSQIKLNSYSIFEFVSDIVEYSDLISKIKLKPDPKFLDTIKRMDEISMKQMLKKMTFTKLLPHIEKIFDMISGINNHGEYQEKIHLFKFVLNSVESREDELERIEIYKIIFHYGLFTNAIDYGSWDVSKKIFELTKFSYIRKFILDNNHLEQLVEEFCNSKSYDLAGISANALLAFINYLNESQMNKIIDAWKHNSQIYESFVAGPKVQRILIANSSKLTKDNIEYLRSQGLEF